jgi:hypothetical protein
MQTLRKWESLERLISDFKNPKTRKYEPRTWDQLPTLPKATRSRILNEAIGKGHVEVHVKVEDGRRKTFYEVKNPRLFVTVPAVKASLKMSDGSRKDLGVFHPFLFKRRGRL